MARLPLSMIRHAFSPLFCSNEYIKVIDGNGTTVLARDRYSATAPIHFAEVSFGNHENIAVQINLIQRDSNARLQFGILPQGLQSG